METEEGVLWVVDRAGCGIFSGGGNERYVSAEA